MLGDDGSPAYSIPALSLASTATDHRLTDPVGSASRAASNSRWSRLEIFLDQLGDRLNPILVKEARQAMKSRQFVVTFSLLLICGWLWTLLFIVSGLPAIYYAPVGPGVLMGYYAVLSIPLLIVVPYAAFRSLAGEWEDGTFELLSITALSSRQIISGKLASAVLQMLVYYSAIAPCVAFTYLLRGIDIVTIFLLLGYSFAASLLLSACGLMMATVTRVRHWQVLLSVVFVMALLVFTFVWDAAFLAFLSEGGTFPLDQPDFWIAHFCGLTFYIPAILLLLFVAAGQITFASENRSTPIRILLLVPQALIVGWYIYLWRRLGHEGALYFMIFVAAIYWAVVGAILTGETAELSPRALRRLPQSFLGRMLFTWFNPGSGTGYVFVIANFAAVLFVAYAVPATGPMPTVQTRAFFRQLPQFDTWLAVSACLLGYLAGYLGATRILVIGLRRFIPVTMPATFLCHIVLVASGVILPLLLQRAITGRPYEHLSYSLLQAPNWAWTLEMASRTGAFRSAIPSSFVVLITGMIIFFINFVLSAREVQRTRQAAPSRVILDDLALNPIVPKKRNPWDEA